MCKINLVRCRCRSQREQKVLPAQSPDSFWGYDTERAFCLPGCSLKAGGVSAFSMPLCAQVLHQCASGRQPSRNFRLDRADSTDNVSARSDNQRLAVETGQLKESNPSFWDCLASVSHAGVTARGFRLVKVEPRDSKSSELVRSVRQFKQQRFRKGLCLQPT